MSATAQGAAALVVLLAFAPLSCSLPTGDTREARSAQATPVPTPKIDPARPFGIDNPTVAQVALKLRDPDLRVRDHATRFLAAHAAEAESAVPALAAALTDPADAVAEGAAFALGHVGPAAEAAVPALVAMLGDDRPDRCGQAGWALVRIGIPDEAVPALVACSRRGGPHEFGRVRAFEALAALRPPPPPVVERLAEGVSESNPKIRALASSSLSALGASELVPALEALADGLSRPSATVRLTALRTIARAGPAGAPALPALYGALRDENAEVRAEARRAILAVRAP